MIDDIQLPLPDKLIEHREAIQVLQNTGITIPGKWGRLNQQLTDFLELKSAALNRLVDSVITPSASDDRTVLRGLAVAEAAATHPAVAQVNNAVINAVLTKLRDTITAAAPSIYAKASDQFNQAAASFHACCEVCDPERPAPEMVSAPDAERTAWMEAEGHAAKLTTLVPPLAVAASLAGIPGIDLNTLDVDCHPTVIGLAVDTTDLQRRRVWEAWLTKDGDGRTGRWGALVALGATIRALPDLKTHQPYPEPRPMEYRDETVVDQHGHATLIRRVPHDPEDDHTPQPIDGRRQPGRVTAV